MRPHSAVLGHSLRTRPYCDRAPPAPWPCPAAGACCERVLVLRVPFPLPAGRSADAGHEITATALPRRNRGGSYAKPPADAATSLRWIRTDNRGKALSLRENRAASVGLARLRTPWVRSFVSHTPAVVHAHLTPRERSSEEGHRSRPLDLAPTPGDDEVETRIEVGPVRFQALVDYHLPDGNPGQRPRISRICESLIPHRQLMRRERTFPACICGSTISACIPAGSVREQQ